MQCGEKVRCINDVFTRRLTDPCSPTDFQCPQKGQIYTVRDVVHTKSGIGLRFEEIKNPLFWYDDSGEREPCFAQERFVPISQGKKVKQNT